MSLTFTRVGFLVWVKVMNKIIIPGLTVLAVVSGFAVGFGVGKKTREVAPSNVDTQFDGGVVTIKADVGSALKQGVLGFLADL